MSLDPTICILWESQYYQAILKLGNHIVWPKHFSRLKGRTEFPRIFHHPGNSEVWKASHEHLEESVS